MAGPARLRLEPRAYASLTGFLEDDALAAFRCFLEFARALAEGRPEERAARPPSAALVAAGRAALAESVENAAAARAFFETWFRPFRVVAEPPEGGFLTGYFEPTVAGSRIETSAFRWPLLGRPDDLVAFVPGELPAGFAPGVSGARRLSDGGLVPYDDRKTIERARRNPIVWVADPVEAFLIQVQGSAQVVFPDGSRARLAYDGRNGLPYASIGRILIETGEIPENAKCLSTPSRTGCAARASARVRRVSRSCGGTARSCSSGLSSCSIPPAARRRARASLDAAALARRRPVFLELWPAVLDRGRASMGGRRADFVPAADDRAGHRLGDCQDRPGPTYSSAAATRRASAPARSAIAGMSPCSRPSETSREGGSAAATL